MCFALSGTVCRALPPLVAVAAGLIAALAPVSAPSASGQIAVVAAENFYGDVAQQVGGGHVNVTSILTNPDQDPHLFETSPSIARLVAGAQIVVYNGADYDAWMDRLLRIDRGGRRATIVAADLLHKKPGDNPHLWYDPQCIPAVAKALAAAFAAADSAHKDDYAARLNVFLASLAPLDTKIAAMRSKYADTSVAASEPVFSYMADALALNVLDKHFQLAVMNGTEPSAADIAAIEHDLAARKVRVFFYNKQATDKIVQHLVSLARETGIPVVGVTETLPPKMSYRDWILSELDATEAALGGSGS